MFDFDVVVVGGGPAGASAAKELISKGINTVIIEKKSMPRHKPCSGLVLRETIDLVKKHFGMPPSEVFAKPNAAKGMRWYFRSGRMLEVPVNAWYVRRDRFDQWLCQESGAMLKDSTIMKSFKEDSEGVTLDCKQKDGEQINIRCKVLIAADGGFSTVARSIDPARHAALKWFVALHYTYRFRGDFEPGYFYFFADPKISLYPAAYVKDGFLIINVASETGADIQLHLRRFKEILERNFGFKEQEIVRKEACKVTWGALQGLTNFGVNRVLIAGEASGLLNAFGEGISSAIGTGIIAGRSVVQGIKKGITPGSIYRKEVEIEKSRTLGQFELRNQLFADVGGIEKMAALRSIPLADLPLVMKDMVAWYRRRGGMKKRMTPN